MATTKPKPVYPDRGRFYSIEGWRLPSVTTILDVVNKPALGPWYAKEERRAFETAILEVAIQAEREGGPIRAGELLDTVIQAVQGVKAGDKEKQKAAAIGTAVHARVEWETKTRLGESVGPKPIIPDAAQLAFMAWEDWAKSVDFEPLLSERVVWHRQHGYAGTADWVAKITSGSRRLVVLGDYKSGKAIYPESHLQNVAYRAALASEGIQTDAGLILRLPKTLEDPAFEAQWVPETTTLADFLAALALWRWQRRSEGKDVGTWRQP